MLSKRQLRRQLLKQRQAMSLADWQQRSDRICQHLRRTTWFQQARTVFAYLSFRKEPTLKPLFDRHRRWGLPRCSGDDLVWHHCQPMDPKQFQTGRYGIMEPLDALPTLMTADLVLVPALACDASGYRLGYGGGYYDRWLQGSCARTVGVIFSEAHVLKLPADGWDQPLDAVCTELGFRQLDGKT